MHFGRNPKRWSSVVFLCALAGCATEQTNRSGQTAPVWSSLRVSGPVDAPQAENPPVSRTSYDAPLEQPAGIAADGPLSGPIEPAADPNDPFAGESELSLETLVRGVQTCNPSLQALVAAWQAAAQRYPQMISLEDPMFGFMIGPAGVGTMDGGGWMVMGSQKIPWPGKRQLRGQAAQAETDVAYREVAERQLMLAEAAKTAFYDYYMAHRQLEVNRSSTALLADFREIARIKYESNKVSRAL